MKVFDKALGIVVLMTIVVLAFGDIGFDKPGKFGLDFGHFLIISAILIICGIALFLRIICSIYKKSAIKMVHQNRLRRPGDFHDILKLQGIKNESKMSVLSI